MYGLDSSTVRIYYSSQSLVGGAAAFCQKSKILAMVLDRILEL